MSPENYITVIEENGKWYVALVQGDSYCIDPDHLREREWAVLAGERATKIQRKRLTERAIASGAEEGSTVSVEFLPLAGVPSNCRRTHSINLQGK